MVAGHGRRAQEVQSRSIVFSRYSPFQLVRLRAGWEPFCKRRHFPKFLQGGRTDWSQKSLALNDDWLALAQETEPEMVYERVVHGP
jgi:hypothetical protein